MLSLVDILKKINKPQLKAISVIEEYLESADKEVQALIKMPTGTGKTGIIGIISNFYEEYRNVLIIAPNNTLPIQIDDEIRVNFWKSIHINPRDINLKRVNVYKVKDFVVPRKNEGTITITTIQSLETLYKEDKKYTKLKESIDLIIFDEGHREPSIEWAKSIRGLGKKTILFTATPYRNDEALFKFSKDKYRYCLTFTSAVEQSLIKSIYFKGIESDVISSKDKFSEFVYQVYKQKAKRKIIIRCKDSNEVKDLTNKINEIHKGEKENNKDNIAIGCHSNFERVKSDCLVASGERVYSAAKDYSIYIHVNMLIEGLNIPDADILFMYGDFENTRSLIQQIGRVVRKKNKGRALIYVNKNEIKWYNDQWDMFLKYEDELESNKSNPSVSYTSNEFKENFILNSSFKDDLLIPKSSIVYEYDALEFEELKSHIKQNLLSKATINSYFEDNSLGDLWIMCYEKINYSNLLRTKSYKEITLECVILRIIERNNRKFLFYYDSRGYSIPYMELDEFLKPLGPEKFLSLFPNSNTNFNQIKVNSLGVSNVGIYGRLIEGSNLQDIHTSINERLSFCRYAKGVVENEYGKKIDRYIGALNSRVIDYEKGGLVDYYNWTEKIVIELLGNETNGYFNRFASPINIGNDMEATSILIDFTGLTEDHMVVERDSQKAVIGIESICVECKNNSFSFNFNDVLIEGNIERSGLGKRVRLRLSITKFRTDYMIKEGESYISLEHYLNREQAFRVFFNKSGIIYSDTYFFSPNIKFRQQDLDSLEIGRQIFVLPGLGKCVEEKFGEVPSVDIFLGMWPNTSVFGCFIYNLLNHRIPTMQPIDCLVCDDFGNEIADFIALDEANKKIILAHCKYGTEKISASAFQEICGQAVKNIGYLIRNNIDSLNVSTHIDWWDNQPWSRETRYNASTGKKIKKDAKISKDTKVTVVKIQTKRILRGGVTGEEFWGKYKSILKSPDSQIEVWLVTNGLSKEALKSELIKVEPEPQIGPLMWILHCTQEVIGEIGGAIKIFCKE